MTASVALDSAGRRRSPATLPGFHSGRPPRNKGMFYPADPPTVEEIVYVMRHASEDPQGFRLRAMIVMLSRGGLRVKEALALSEHDLDPRRGSAMAERWRSWLSAWEAWRAEAEEYVELDDERVLVPCHFDVRGKTSGVELGGVMPVEAANVFHVRDGKVTRLPRKRPPSRSASLRSASRHTVASDDAPYTPFT